MSFYYHFYMDLFAKLKQNKGPLGKYSSVAQGYFAFPKLEGPIGPSMRFRGQQVLVWSLNNYLGLANHPSVREADGEAAMQYGLGYPMGARMMSGNSDLLEELERELSAFVEKEDTLVLNYGYQGILSVIDAILSRHDVAIYDSECHASIVDGLRLHAGSRFVFPHNNIQSLTRQLEKATRLTQQSSGGILVITEGVFGMAGDMGNLREIVELKKKFSFRLLVDDAHGFGTMGESGAGTGEEQGVQEGIDLYFSTFAKAMAGIGAFVSSQKDVIDYLRYNTRSQIFAKTLPMPMVAGLKTRLQLLKAHPGFRNKLWEVARVLQSELRKKGFNIGQTTSPVTPVILNGTIGEALRLIVDLRENYHIFCSVVIYPVVPKGTIMLRLIPTAEHTLEDVRVTVEAFEQVAVKLTNGAYEKNIAELIVG